MSFHVNKTSAPSVVKEVSVSIVVSLKEAEITFLAKPSLILKATACGVTPLSKLLTEPVQLAPQKGYGEVSWKTPIQKNAMEVPVKEKIDLLLSVNNAALDNGAAFVNSALFMINEQKYFASTDGSYIDQDIHRIWPNFTVTAVNKAEGLFRSRQALSAPMGMGYEYLDGLASEKFMNPAGFNSYRNSYDMVEDAIFAAKQAKEKLTAKSVTGISTF